TLDRSSLHPVEVSSTRVGYRIAGKEIGPRARRNDSRKGPIPNDTREDTVSGWRETYRGIVYRWEVDHNDHLTVAFYFARLVDARRRVSRALTPAQRRVAEGQRVDWDGPARERRPRPAGLEGFRDSARDTVKPDEVDVFGQVALTHYVHRFSAANGHATAAFGITPGYMRTERRGFSTFEFQLEVGGVLRPGDPVCVRSALVHVGNSSMRLLHVMTNERTAERIATLEQLGVHLDMDARRPSPLPDAIRERAKAILVV